jgi:hypothetical protein
MEVSALTSMYNKLSGAQSYFDTKSSQSDWDTYNTGLAKKYDDSVGTMKSMPHYPYNLKKNENPFDPQNLGLYPNYLNDGSEVAGMPPHFIDFR